MMRREMRCSLKIVGRIRMSMLRVGTSARSEYITHLPTEEQAKQENVLHPLLVSLLAF